MLTCTFVFSTMQLNYLLKSQLINANFRFIHSDFLIDKNFRCLCKRFLLEVGNFMKAIIGKFFELLPRFIVNLFI